VELTKDFMFDAKAGNGPGGNDSTIVTGLQFSPDGKTFAEASPPQWVLVPVTEMRSGRVSIRDLRTGKRLASYISDPNPGDRRPQVIMPIYSSDGRSLLIRSEQYPPIVWRWQEERSKWIKGFDTIPKPTPESLAEMERDFASPRVNQVTVSRSDDGLIVRDGSGRRLPMGAWIPASEVSSAAVSPDFQTLAVAVSDLVKMLRLFRDSTSLLVSAKSAMPRCLTQEQRKQYNLGQIPPRWCITGPGQEKEPDSAKWSGVWPYDTDVYRNWLLASDAARSREVSRRNRLWARLFGDQRDAALPFPVAQGGK
jgi:WD40 repeat protein